MTHHPSSFFINKINDRVQNPKSAKSMFYFLIHTKGINYIDQPYGGRLYDLKDWDKKVSDTYRIGGV